MSKKWRAKVESKLKGTAEYRLKSGAYVFFAHWSADPMKTDEWADAMSSGLPGGRQSIDWLREMEADDSARTGERTYWAFERERNLIPRFKVPVEWPVYLGADFGQVNATAIIFIAQDPVTRRMYVIDSIVTPKGMDVGVKERIYEKLASHFGVQFRDLALAGAYRYIERAVRDPTAKSYGDFYAMEPYPINFMSKVGETATNKSRLAGEARVNSAFWLWGYCCGKLQTADYSDDPSLEMKCRLGCGKMVKVAPALSILEGAGSNDVLCDQLEQLVKKEAAFEGLEISDQDVQTPHDACDALKYVCFDMEWEPESGPSDSQLASRELNLLRSKKPYELEYEDKLRLLMAEAQRAQDRDETMKGKRRGRSMFWSPGDSPFPAISRIKYRSRQHSPAPGVH